MLVQSIDGNSDAWMNIVVVAEGRSPQDNSGLFYGFLLNGKVHLLFEESTSELLRYSWRLEAEVAFMVIKEGIERLECPCSTRTSTSYPRWHLKCDHGV